MCKYIWMHACYAVHVEVKGQLGELILFFTMWSQILSPSCQAWQHASCPLFWGRSHNI